MMMTNRLTKKIAWREPFACWLLPDAGEMMPRKRQEKLGETAKSWW